MNRPGAIATPLRALLRSGYCRLVFWSHMSSWSKGCRMVMTLPGAFLLLQGHGEDYFLPNVSCSISPVCLLLCLEPGRICQKHALPSRPHRKCPPPLWPYLRAPAGRQAHSSLLPFSMHPLSFIVSMSRSHFAC